MNTTHFMNRVMGNLFRSQMSPALPTAYYLGLSTTEPNLGGTGISEPSAGAGYTRKQITSFTEPANGVVKNASSIAFDSALASWGTIPYYCIFDAATGGNLLMWGALATPKTVSTGDVLVFATNDLTITLENRT